jgi:TonB family protein
MIGPSHVFVLVLTAFSLSVWAQNSDPYAAPGLASISCPAESSTADQSPHSWIYVSGGVMTRNRIGGKDPKYPSDARKGHVEGRVVLKVTVSGTGDVEDVCVLNGPEMLQQSAYDAVKTWKYRPFLLNGQPKEVKSQLNVDFTLTR